MSVESDVTLGELWRQGNEIKNVVNSLDGKLDSVSDRVTTHDGDIQRLKLDLAEIRADLKSKRITTATIAGVIATVVTAAGELLAHMR